VAIILKDNSRIFEVVNKASYFLSRVIRKCTGHFAEMENILIVGVHAQTRRHVPLTLSGVQARPLSFRYLHISFQDVKLVVYIF
jgi:hypothetical protein